MHKIARLFLLSVVALFATCLPAPGATPRIVEIPERMVPELEATELFEWRDVFVDGEPVSTIVPMICSYCSLPAAPEGMTDEDQRGSCRGCNSR